MKQDWTITMKQKLEGHKMAPPAALWESISHEMGLAAVPVQKQPVVSRMYWAVAAAVLALVGIFVFNRNSHQQSLPSAPMPIVGLDQTHHEQLAIQQLEEPVMQQKEETVVLQTKVPARTVAVLQQTEPVKEVVVIEQDEESVPENQQVDDTPRESTISHHIAQQSEQSVRSVPEQYTPAQSLPRARKWSLGVNASGGLLAADATKQSYSDYCAVSYPSVDYYTTEHQLPVRLGMSLHYQLSPRVALLSGLSYTYLSSKTTYPILHEVHYQNLHYLGIPLGLSWQLWSYHRFSLYLSGSAMFEKCLNRKPWQWSLSAAAGAEYALTKQLGIYLEPSLGYYFDDGTSLQHYYKEHPLAPSIEFGLRLHLSR